MKHKTGDYIVYCLLPLGSNLLIMLISSYLNVYYTDVLHLPTAALATMFLITRIWDAGNDLLFGSFIDRMQFKSRLKYLPWLRIAIFILPLSAILLFLPMPGPIWLKIGFTYVFYIIYELSGTMTSLPHSALVTVISTSTKQRDSLISFSTFTGIIGSVVGVALGGYLVEQIGYLQTALLFCSIAVLCMIPILKIKTEYHQAKKQAQHTLKEILQRLWSNKNLLSFNLSYFFLLATSFITTIGTYFVKWNLGDLKLMGLVMISNFTPVALIPLLLPILIPIIGKRFLYISGLCLAIILSIVQYFLGYSNLPLFLAVNAIKIVGIYLPVTMSGMFIAECNEQQLQENGDSSTGLNFALGSFTNKIGSAVSGALSLFLLGIFSYNGEALTQTSQALQGIWILTSILPVSGMIIALLIFIIYYKNPTNKIPQSTIQEG